MTAKKKPTKGYSVYISEKDIPLLIDILSSDVFFTEQDEYVEAKRKIIDKILKKS